MPAGRQGELRAKEMDLKEIQDRLNSKFSGQILNWTEKNPRRVYAEVEPGALREVARELFADLKFRFAIASGVQTLEGFQILYHFSLDRTGLVLSLRVKLGKVDPEVDSIADLVPAADWIEREIYDLLGVKFKGRTGLKRLLMSDDWPDGVFPLRKDFKGIGIEDV